MAAGVNNLNPLSLDAVKPKQTWRLGVNNLNPLCLDTQNKYGRRAHHLKPNLNTSYFQDGR